VERKPINEAYDFRLVGSDNNIFLFETDAGVTYEVKFVPSGYLWESNPNYADYLRNFFVKIKIL
jgi:hypothetical protein